MAFDPFVTQWIKRLKDGDDAATELVWGEYFEKLVRLARRRLADASRREADEEDIALSAFQSFFAGVKEGRFPKLDDRNDLWKILVVITTRKTHAHRRRNTAQKRGGGEVRGDSVFQMVDKDSGFHQVEGSEPSPDLAAEVADECLRLLDDLGDEKLREVALCKLTGYTNEEIATKLGCTPRTIERKLELIRSKWKEFAP